MHEAYQWDGETHFHLLTYRRWQTISMMYDKCFITEFSLLLYFWYMLPISDLVNFWKYDLQNIAINLNSNGKIYMVMKAINKNVTLKTAKNA